MTEKQTSPLTNGGTERTAGPETTTAESSSNNPVDAWTGQYPGRTGSEDNQVTGKAPKDRNEGQLCSDGGCI